MRQRALLGCLLFSGCAGLIHEVLWIRLLALSMGSTAASFSTVLAVFFGGLALGAFVAGKRAARLVRPARAYAWIEILAGSSALVLFPILRNLGSVFAAIDPGPGVGGAIVRCLIAIPLLLVPTFLMGATLPVVTRAIVRDDATVGRDTALLYGFNTLGAFLGSYVVTYHLLGQLGTLGAQLVGVALNLVAALLAFTVRDEPASTPSVTEGPAIEGRHRELMLVAALTTVIAGFAAILLQVVWARLFAIFLDGTIYGLGAVLISVLGGIAIGSLLIAPILARTEHAAAWLVGVQGVAALSLVAFCYSVELIAYVTRAIPLVIKDTDASLHAQLLFVVIVLIVPASCSGAAFPLLLRIVEQTSGRASGTLGSLYAANTVGSILGSLVGGFVLLPHAGSEATLYTGLALTCTAALIAAALLTREEPPILRGALAALGLVALAVFPGFDARLLALPSNAATGFEADRVARRKELSQIAYFSEGEMATVRLTKNPSGMSLTLNGLGQGSIRRLPPQYVLESLLVAALPMAHTASVADALVVGLGSGGTVDALVKLGVERVTVCELEPRVVDAVELSFPQDPPTRSSHVNVQFDDARHFLLRNAVKGEHRYDLITAMPAHPWVSNSIFTREFFGIAKASLKEHGVFATWFGSPRMDKISVASVIAAFVGTFDYYFVYYVPEAIAFYLVGSDRPIPLDDARISVFVRHPILRDTSFNSPLFLASRVIAAGVPSDPRPNGLPLNTDDSALVELRAPLTATTTAPLSGYLSVEHLRPSTVRAKDPDRFFRSVLETKLGVPGGGPAIHPLPVDLAGGRRLLAATRDVLAPGWASYFEARFEESPARSREALLQLIEDPIVGPRAALEAALLLPPGQSRKMGLLSAPPSWARTIELLEESPDEARRAAMASVDEPTDAVGLLVRRWAVGSAAPPITSEQREALGPMLAKTKRLELLRICEEVFEQQGALAEAKLCQHWRDAQEKSTAKTLVGQASRPQVGQGPGAVELLTAAARLDPAAPNTGAWVRALVAKGEMTDDMRSLIRFLGVPRVTLDAVIAEAEQDKQARRRGGP